MAPKNTDPQTRKRTRRQTHLASTSNPTPTPSSNSPPPLVTYQRFISEKAEERYQEIKEREFVGEHAFDLVNLTGYRTYEATLREKQWEGLNAMVTKNSNKSIALEFFANAYDGASGDFFTTVRGKRVDYEARDINTLLGLPNPYLCDVEWRRVVLNQPKANEEWDALLDGLMKEGKGWRRRTPASNPQRINTTNLLPTYRAWASFINSTICSTSSAAEMPVARVFILLVLLSEHEQMNVGKLISYSIKEMVTTKNITLGHSCFINLLCEKAGVPTEPLDVYFRSQLSIIDTTMEGYQKNLRTAGGSHYEPKEQPEIPEQQLDAYPPLHPAMAEYIYGSANWMDEASSQLYIELPRFSQQFSEMDLQHRKKLSGSFERFGSRDRMRSYFHMNKDRAVRREREIEEDYDYGENVELAIMLGNAPTPDMSGFDQRDQ